MPGMTVFDHQKPALTEIEVDLLVDTLDMVLEG